MKITARSQWTSSAVEYRSLLYSTAEKGHYDLAEIFIFVSFHLYMSQRRSPAGHTTLLSVLYSTAEEGQCDLAEIFIFVSSICLSDAHPRAGRRSRQSQVSAALSPFHFCLFNNNRCEAGYASSKHTLIHSCSSATEMLAV